MIVEREKRKNDAFAQVLESIVRSRTTELQEKLQKQKVEVSNLEDITVFFFLGVKMYMLGENVDTYSNNVWWVLAGLLVIFLFYLRREDNFAAYKSSQSTLDVLAEKLHAVPAREVLTLLDEYGRDAVFYQKFFSFLNNGKNTVLKDLIYTAQERRKELLSGKKTHQVIKVTKKVLGYGKTITVSDAFQDFAQSLSREVYEELFDESESLEQEKIYFIEDVIAFVVNNNLTLQEAGRFLVMFDELLYEDAAAAEELERYLRLQGKTLDGLYQGVEDLKQEESQMNAK